MHTTQVRDRRHGSSSTSAGKQRAPSVLVWHLLQCTPAPPTLTHHPTPADAPALVDSMRHGLLPLVRQGRRGPVLDLDALLLVLMNDYCDGGLRRVGR